MCASSDSSTWKFGAFVGSRTTVGQWEMSHGSASGTWVVLCVVVCVSFQLVLTGSIGMRAAIYKSVTAVSTRVASCASLGGLCPDVVCSSL